MALTLEELEGWRDEVQGRLTIAQGQLAAVRLRSVGTHWHERFLHAGAVGNLRSRVVDLGAQVRYLNDAVSAVTGGGTHPAQGLPLGAAVVGRKSAPPKPPRWQSL